MTLARLAAARDGNEVEIIEGLTCVGCLVAQVSGTGVPDLVVWSPFTRRLHWLEVKDGRKTPSKRKLKPAQVVFIKRWSEAGAPVGVVLSLEEALVAVGARPKPQTGPKPKTKKVK